MTEVTKAEQHRRAREWLRIDFDDAQQTAAFEAAKRALSCTDTADVDALIAIGEFGCVRASLPAIEDPAAFVRALGSYFMTTADDGVVRGMRERVVATVRSEKVLPKETLQSLAFAAEAIGDRVLAAELNERARSAQSSAPAMGEVVNTVNGMLGYAPDAPKGRLLLRPEIDPGWNRLGVRNLHIGDALIDFTYTRDAGRMTFEFVQVAGAYPVRLIFEPILSVPVTSAFVDGNTAQLDFRPHGDRIIVPVQIVLDERRSVELE